MNDEEYIAIEKILEKYQEFWNAPRIAILKPYPNNEGKYNILSIIGSNTRDFIPEDFNLQFDIKTGKFEWLTYNEQDFEEEDFIEGEDKLEWWDNPHTTCKSRCPPLMDNEFLRGITVEECTTSNRILKYFSLFELHVLIRRPDIFPSLDIETQSLIKDISKAILNQRRGKKNE